jgi:hypothetical protein
MEAYINPEWAKENGYSLNRLKVSGIKKSEL